ncbi:MAG: tetraacyldisaccharide 4'-kinase [Deltaproteobacteria bacterium]
MIGPFAEARRWLYRRGFLHAEALPRPVISVGNLAVGGAGKTPHVQFLASWLAGLGARPAVLSRGYGRKSRGVVWVSHGEGPLVPADVGGDEPVLLASLLPGVPVLAGEVRADAGRECLKRREVDVFLLDDGFQHLRLSRDADLLLVDAGRGLGNRRTLPLGPLREPAGSARFADALIVTKCADLAKGRETAAAIPFPPGRPRAFSSLSPRSLVDREGRESPLPAGNVEVAAFCGLARNGQFSETLAEAGFAVRKFLAYGDHHRYRPKDFEEIAAAAKGLPVLTTEKDLVRLPAALPFDVKALRVGVAFIDGWQELSRFLLERVRWAGTR